MMVHTPMMRRREVLATAGGLISVGLAGCIGENDSEGNDPDEYPERDINWIVTYSSGGGFDAYARAFAEYLPSHLPNDVDIVVENIEGAAGRTGANTLYRADPDGYTIGILNVPGLTTAQIAEDTEYDLAEFSWIGRADQDPQVLLAAADTGYETLSDLQEADDLRFATQGKGTLDYAAGTLSREVMDIDLDFVTGYDGSTEAMTGVIRGDAHLTSTVGTTARELIQDGNLNPIVIFSEDGPDYLSDVPTSTDEGHESLTDLLAIQRLIAGPPGMDSEIVDILSNSIQEAMESDDFQQWSEESDRPLEPASPDEVEEIVENSLDTFSEYEDDLV